MSSVQKRVLHLLVGIAATIARECVAWPANRGHASAYRDWPLDCLTALQWGWSNRQYQWDKWRGRRCVYGSHWRLLSWLFADLPFSGYDRPPNV